MQIPCATEAGGTQAAKGMRISRHWSAVDVGGEQATEVLRGDGIGHELHESARTD